MCPVQCVTYVSGRSQSGHENVHVMVVTNYSFDPVEESELVGEFKEGAR